MKAQKAKAPAPAKGAADPGKGAAKGAAKAGNGPPWRGVRRSHDGDEGKGSRPSQERSHESLAREIHHHHHHYHHHHLDDYFFRHRRQRRRLELEVEDEVMAAWNGAPSEDEELQEEEALESSEEARNSS